MISTEGLSDSLDSAVNGSILNYASVLAQFAIIVAICFSFRNFGRFYRGIRQIELSNQTIFYDQSGQQNNHPP